jgi:hypothetical protein
MNEENLHECLQWGCHKKTAKLYCPEHERPSAKPMAAPEPTSAQIEVDLAIPPGQFEDVTIADDLFPPPPKPSLKESIRTRIFRVRQELASLERVIEQLPDEPPRP